MKTMNKNILDRLILIVLFLGIVTLFFEHGASPDPHVRLFINIVDYAIIILFITETVLRFVAAPRKLNFLRFNLFSLLLLTVLVTLFILNKITSFRVAHGNLTVVSTNIIILRNAFVALKILGRIKRLNYFIKSITTHPAQTIVTSFFIIIVVGGILLMLPFASNGELHAMEALFTSTSAVCVTGLIVVDTATKFTVYGQIIIMILIQIGGLGIMILSYFGAFVVGKRISLEEKLAMSYLLNEQDLHKISESIAKIIIITFAIEIIGAIFLFNEFSDLFGFTAQTLLFSAFHAVSAFCNAGFALFTNSLENFQSSTPMNMIICLLIILGGISFPVIFNLIEIVISRVRNMFRKRVRGAKLNLNAKAVLIMTGILILGGTLLIYGFEHGSILLTKDLKTQYLNAFFQSVTLRTAGFNTINLAKLHINTLLIMMLFMFIGGASGSTAGGIKVNTFTVIYAYLYSIFRGRENTTLMNHSISKDLVNKSFFIVILAIIAVFVGALILSISENFAFEEILFEVVSAFGTVGLSLGITGALSGAGKIVIIILMFIGRIGPLTLIVALSRKQSKLQIRYPEGNVLIG